MSSGGGMSSGGNEQSIARLKKKIAAIEAQEKKVTEMFKADPKSLGNALAPIEQELVKLQSEEIDLGVESSIFKQAEEGDI